MKETQLFGKVVIVGIGLIGGSIGCAIRAGRLASEVVGVVRNRETERMAKEKGAVDRAVLGFDAARMEYKDADLVLVCMPVSTILDFIRVDHQSLLLGNAIVADVGSTKVEIAQVGQQYLGDRFVGCHPFTGSEKSGVANADAKIFKESFCFITKAGVITNPNVQRVANLWRMMGTQIRFMNPEEHDALVASLSHLPHLLAFSLLLTFEDSESRDIGLMYGNHLNPSMGALVRLAKSDPVMWGDIFWSNRRELLERLSKFEQCIEKFKSILERQITKDPDEGKAPVEELCRLILRSHYRAEDFIPDRSGQNLGRHPGL